MRALMSEDGKRGGGVRLFAPFLFYFDATPFSASIRLTARDGPHMWPFSQGHSPMWRS